MKFKEWLTMQVKLYGWRTAIIRIVKVVLRRCLGFNLEKHYLMSSPLNEEEPLPIRSDIEIHKLSLSDFETPSWQHFFSEEKRRIYELRFLLPHAKAYGAFVDGRLAYSTWIQYGEVFLSKEVSLFKTDDAALLLDSYCHPDFRGRGLHNYVNHWCLQKMQADGVKKAYVLILSYNTPAYKTQLKCGLSIERTFYTFTLGKKTYCTYHS